MPRKVRLRTVGGSLGVMLASEFKALGLGAGDA
jgi:hypothetical protein